MSESPKYVAKVAFESDSDFTFPLATNMLVNFDNDFFYVRFYQVSPPTILDGQPPETVKAKLVAGTIIHISKMEGVINALQENYSKRLELDQDDFDLDLDELEDMESKND